MRALLLEEYMRLAYVETPEPEIGESDVLIAVRACGICGSDVHGMDGSSGRRQVPIIMGHEAAGVIAAVGAAVEGWRTGDRVTFDSTVSCGGCHFCRAGHINLCDNRRVLGVSCGEYRRHGAFADYVAVPQHILYRVPDGLPLEHAAMVEPVSVAVHAVELTPLALGATAVVIGAGMIGLFVVQVLRAAGAGKIIAIDLLEEKLELAKTLGADVGLSPEMDDVAARVAELTDGRGADVCVEVVGIGPTLEMSVSVLRKGGALTLVGNLTPKVPMPIQAIVTREITLYGSCASNGEYPACLELIQRGAIQVAPLISALAPLSEGADWFRRLYGGEKGLMKVILQPEGNAS